MPDVITPALDTPQGVLRFPKQAAAAIVATPPVNTHPVITNAVLSTVAGVQRFPKQTADFIAAMP